MSEPSIPWSLAHLNTFLECHPEHQTAAPRFESASPQRRPPRKSGLYALLHAAQQHGITYPRDGFWTMLPKEFQAILALESKDVRQVVLEIPHSIELGSVPQLP
jgi:hypothetical protein